MSEQPPPEVLQPPVNSVPPLNLPQPLDSPTKKVTVNEQNQQQPPVIAPQVPGKSALKRQQESNKGNNPADWDKLPMDAVIKKANLTERDWYYLESRIRTQIHDLLLPYISKTDLIKDQFRDVRETVNNCRATIEDLQMAQARFQRYDEYFLDQNKKMGGLDQSIRMLDKRLNDDVNIIYQHRDKMKDNIKEIEDDLMKIKNEFAEKQQNNVQLLQDVLDVRDKIKTDMVEEIRQMNEEVIVQNERIVELGHQIYSTKLYTERKFLQNADLDVRIRSANELFKEVSSRLEKLKSKVRKQKGWIHETDRHLKHYVPFQVGTLIFDSLFRSAETPQAQQNYKDYFMPLFEKLEQHIKQQNDGKANYSVIPPPCGPDLTFEKLTYVIPSSMQLPLMTDRSLLLRKTEKLDASVKDKKGGKKDKKDKDKDKETSGSRTPVTNMSNAGGAAPVRASKDKITVSSKRTNDVGDYGAGFGNKAEVPSPLLRNVQSNLGDPISEDQPLSNLDSKDQPAKLEEMTFAGKLHSRQNEPHPMQKLSHQSGAQDQMDNPRKESGFTGHLDSQAQNHQRNIDDKSFVSFNNQQNNQHSKKQSDHKQSQGSGGKTTQPAFPGMSQYSQKNGSFSIQQSAADQRVSKQLKQSEHKEDVKRNSQYNQSQSKQSDGIESFNQLRVPGLKGMNQEPLGMKKGKQSFREGQGSSSQRNQNNSKRSKTIQKLRRDSALQQNEDSQSLFHRAHGQDQSYHSGSGSEEESSSDSSEKATRRYNELLNMIAQTQQQIVPLKDKVDSFTPLMTTLVEECKTACKSAIDLFNEEARSQAEMILELKAEYESTMQRNRLERADLQMMHGQVRSQSDNVSGNIIKCLEEISKIKSWCSKAKEIFQLQNVIQRQDEVDKQSITLIGTKDSKELNVSLMQEKKGSTIESPRNLKKEAPILSIDTNCVNCHNNPSAADRQLLLHSFKMACLSYKPKQIEYKDRVYGRLEVLDIKKSMIQQLDEQGQTFLDFDLASVIINVESQLHVHDQSYTTVAKKLAQTSPPHMLRNNHHGMSMSSSQPDSTSKIMGFVDVEHDRSQASIENAILNQSPLKATPLQNLGAQSAQINQWMRQRLHRKTRELQAQDQDMMNYEKVKGQLPSEGQVSFLKQIQTKTHGNTNRLYARPNSVMNDISPQTGPHVIFSSQSVARGSGNRVIINKLNSKGHYHKNSIDSPAFTRFDLDPPQHSTSIISIGESYRDQRKIQGPPSVLGNKTLTSLPMHLKNKVAFQKYNSGL